MANPSRIATREQLLFNLYEAAELEHNLMCTYLYAAFSLRSGSAEGLSPREAEAVAGWRRTILQIAVEEMGHLTAVWNISAALGGAPRFGRANFPLDPGYLPAGIVVKLVPFGEPALQHFVHLERPQSSSEPDGSGFSPELAFQRGTQTLRLTPTVTDYLTVGEFYEQLGSCLLGFAEHHGDKLAFCGDPALQLSSAEVPLFGAKPVICSKTALAAFTAIREQGEGAPEHSETSHYTRFRAMHDELLQLKAQNPHFSPAFPAAHNPVLRKPLRSEGRVWIENEEAAHTVDLANSGYALMLRLLGYAYLVPRPEAEKSLAIELGTGLMRAVTLLGERAARLPAGASNPDCHAGMSFTALRDTGAFPPSEGARHAFVERFAELRSAAQALAQTGDERCVRAARQLEQLHERAQRGFGEANQRQSSRSAVLASAPAAAAPRAAAATPGAAAAPITTEDGIPIPRVENGVEHIQGKSLTLIYEGKRCIHARFCVTGAPQVFLANVKGPWIAPDAIEAARLVEIAHACPSGAIRYERQDGQPNEAAPPVNLLAVREAGPYAVRGELSIAGNKSSYRATLCRCGASRNKPYCDGSHHEVGFAATGEPATGQADMLPVRGGPLEVEPQVDGPLQVRGNLEITSGTGRVVARLTQARLCRCGGSANKPFCDGTHAKIGFRS
ncbi:MAG TPA: ferritin-like domain-containing protein [Polyangiaceae bacterium]|nr:ferritin-like domain-containing protein [Polyangiaceae bacterium]